MSVQSIICILAVILLAASCSKTASNTLALLGSWELIRSDVSTGNVTETFYPEYLTVFQFNSHDEYVITEASSSGSTTTTGRWYVEGDSLTITLPGGGHRTFRIEETHLTKLVLSEIEGDTVYRHTFKYMSVK